MKNGLLKAFIKQNKLRGVLDEMIGLRYADEIPADQKDGVDIAMIEEEADWQLSIYQKTSDTPIDLQEKLDALAYAMKLLKFTLQMRQFGVAPVYPKQVKAAI